MNLNQITIPSQDVPRAVGFYQKLGLKLIVDSSPRYVRFACPDGNASFSIHAVETVAKGEGVYVYFECDDLEREVHRLKALGVTFEQDIQDQTWLWREARLRDPDGHVVILYFAGENRLNPPWRI